MVARFGRWYRFHRNSGTVPIPLLKNINKRQNVGPGLPKENFRIRASLNFGYL